MDVGERIYELRKSRNLTMEELGKKVGVGKSTIHKWETGSISNMRSDNVERLADALGVPIAYLLGVNEAPVDCIEIPVLGRVAAGLPIEAIEYKLGTVVISQEKYKTGNYFALQIHGDSMSPTILDGDIVIVRQQEDAESGEIVIATINGDDATCKRLRKHRDGIELISNNPSYPPFDYSKKEIVQKPVRIIGKVVELRRKF